MTLRKIQPATHPVGPGVKYMMPVASARLIAVQMNTWRRPILSATQPQQKAPGTAPIPEDSRMTAACPYVSCHSLVMNANT